MLNASIVSNKDGVSYLKATSRIMFFLFFKDDPVMQGFHQTQRNSNN